MSEFKHKISYYKDIVRQSKGTAKRIEVLPMSQVVNAKYVSQTKDVTREATKTRVQVIMNHHGAVLRALKNR